MTLETEVARTGTKALSGFLRCGTLVTDPFFRSRFIDEAGRFLESLQSLGFKCDRTALIKTIRPLESLLDEVSYVGLCPQLPTQEAKKELWQWIFELVKPIRQKATGVGRVKSKKQPKERIDSKDNQLSRGVNYDQAVMAYLAGVSKSRAYEVVLGLKKIPPRTVKRSLNRLAKRGVINKEIEGRAVWYSMGK